MQPQTRDKPTAQARATSTGLSPSLHHPIPGAVVQLVRMPACHAGGREFESRPHRRRERRMSNLSLRTWLLILFFCILSRRRLVGTHGSCVRLPQSLSFLSPPSPSGVCICDIRCMIKAEALITKKLHIRGEEILVRAQASAATSTPLPLPPSEVSALPPCRPSGRSDARTVRPYIVGGRPCRPGGGCPGCASRAASSCKTYKFHKKFTAFHIDY